MDLNNKNIPLYVISFLLIGILLLPSVIQFSHLLENHEHKFCKDYSNHFHEIENHCSINFFHFSAFNFSPISVSHIIPPKISALVFEYYTLLIVSQNPSQFHKRGPPVIS